MLINNGGNKMAQTSVEPFKRVSNVHVNMVVVHPAPVVNLGNMLILHKQTANTTQAGSGTSGGSTTPTTPGVKLSKEDIENGILMSNTDTLSGSTYREYSSASAVETDYDPGSDVAVKAESYFSQEHPSDRVAVLTYTDGKLPDALKAFWYNNWVFAIFAEKGMDDAQIASNIFEANEDHILILQSENVQDGMLFKGQNYTKMYQTVDNEPIDAAIIGRVASLPVGQNVWKFKQVNGITPQHINTNQEEALEKANVSAYIYVGGVPQMSSGTVGSGEYLDSIHGDIWIKDNIQGELQRTFQSNDKIPYNQNGINLLLAQVNSVLAKAFSQGIIQQDDVTQKGIYSVTATPRSAQSQRDLSDRHYGGISFTYKRAGAIEDITVNGIIQSDTIQQVLG